MDVVYVLGKGSRWKDNELRYSLRSVEKYLIGYDKIFIVGECPEWLTGVIHIPFSDVFGRKDFNIMRKVIVACENDQVSDDFIFFNDDHFLLQPIDVKEIKYWHSCSLEQKGFNSEGSGLIKIRNTTEIIPGYSYFFDIHVPIVYNKKEFRRIMFLPILKWEEKEYLIKTVYANICTSQDVTYNVEYMQDCKISKILGYDQLLSKISDRYFFSIGPEGVKADLKRLLSELYPTKSKYEL